MRLLHTADWHVGKTVRGRSRSDEHEAVLAEIVALADTRRADLVVVAGDLFDTAAPSPEAERIVYGALLALAAEGARPVVVVAGNHDHARRLEAVAPVFAGAGVHLVGTARPPDEGGVLAFDLAGTPVRVAALPFVSQRGIVGLDALMAGDAAEHGQAYAERLQRVVAALAEGFADDAVNLFVVHAMVTGGVLGGGERSAHTIFDYAVPTTVFPPNAHYVALGHLHRTQSLPGPCPIWYPGSPLQLDFGEQADDKHVLVVEAAPGVPAAVERVPLSAGRRFRTVTGTLAELGALAPAADDDFVRVVVREQARVGLAEDVRELFPGAVEIRIERPDGEGPTTRPADAAQRSAHDLFADYLTATGAEDPDLLALFDDVHDHVATVESA